MSEIRGTIFDIKRFALHDGPGIRTTVFLKGCPLRCKWCHNPEAVSPRPQLSHFPRNCIGCGKCIEVCPQGAITATAEGNVIDRGLCDDCGKCAEVCYAEALVLVGEEKTAEEVITEVAKDRAYYRTSGGGMTVSGGEPLLQPEFTRALLEQARELDIATCLDTSGYAKWEVLAGLLPLVDLLLYDLKLADSEAHHEHVGVDNELILENLRRSAETGVETIVRVPAVPGLTDSEENIAALADLVRQADGIQGVELLPYHRLGESKYESLGGTYPLGKLDPPSREHLAKLAAVIESRGLRCKVEQ